MQMQDTLWHPLVAAATEEEGWPLVTAAPIVNKRPFVPAATEKTERVQSCRKSLCLTAVSAIFPIPSP
jgi:hypothetical protein